MKSNTQTKPIMKIKHLFLVLFGLAAALAVNAQTWPAGMQPHGSNSSGNPTPAEATDSVTVGGVLDYFVMPDPVLNPGYDFTTNPLTNLNSTFNWTGTTGASSIVYKKSGPTDIPNYVTITWGNTPGAYQVSVYEISAAGCQDATPTTIPVQIIAAPTLTYPAAGGSESICGTGTDGSLNINPSPITVNFTSSVSGNRQMQLVYTITSASHGTIASNVTANITEAGPGTGTFTLAAPLQYYDTYTVTLNTVSDRISRKSNVVSNASGNTTFTVVITPTPNTGTIYHLPNQ